MQDIRLIIFDLDGTLVDAYVAIQQSFNYTIQKLHYPRRSSQIIRQAVGWGDESLLKPFIKKDDLQKALFLYRRHHRSALLKGARLYPGTLRVLTYLKKKGFYLAIASNRPTKFSWILLRHLKIAKYFDYVLCSDRLKQGKPHPEILNKIKRKFSCKSSAVLYVGDMAIDAQAGRRAKIKTFIVATGSSGRSAIKKEKPQRIINRITDLLGIF